MAKIDMDMLESMKRWWDKDRPVYQTVKYIESKDRLITQATIKRLILEVLKNDVLGEEDISYFSAKNFSRNMRSYFYEITRLYGYKPPKRSSVSDIIASIPPTCGWITLLIGNLDEISDFPDKLDEIFRATFSLAAKGGNVVLIGNGSYRNIFSKCNYALQEMEYRLNAKMEDGIVGIGLYEQDSAFKCADEDFESEYSYRFTRVMRGERIDNGNYNKMHK